MPKLICRDCHHPEEVHNVNGKGECACGCIRLRPIDREAREARKRQWIASVSFFVRNRWIESGDFKVRALGLGGATVEALRQAKREHLKPRTRIQQTLVRITHVRAGRVATKEVQ